MLIKNHALILVLIFLMIQYVFSETSEASEFSDMFMLNIHNQDNSTFVEKNNKRICSYLDQLIISELNGYGEIREDKGIKLKQYGLKGWDIEVLKINSSVWIVAYNIPIGQAGSVRKAYLRLFKKDSKSYKMFASSDDVLDYETNIELNKMAIESIKIISQNKFFTVGNYMCLKSIALWTIRENMLFLKWSKIIDDCYAEVDIKDKTIFIQHPKNSKIVGKGWVERDHGFKEVYTIEDTQVKFQKKEINKND